MSEVQPTPPAQVPTTAGGEVNPPTPTPAPAAAAPVTPPEGAAPAAASAAPAGEQKPKEGETPPPETPAKVVPEKYALKLEEHSHLDPTNLASIEAYAKANKLSQEEAQGLVAKTEADTKAFVESRKAEWLKQSTSDKEVGGDHLKENVAHASRAIERFASPALKAELNKTGYGNHPEMIRMLSRIGKSMAEDKLILPGSQGSASKPMEEVFYGGTKF